VKEAERVAVRVSEKVGILDPPREIRAIITEVLEDEGANPSIAAEDTDRLLKSVTEHLFAIENSRLNDGQYCSHTFCSEGTHLIQGAGHPDPGIAANVVATRVARGALPGWLAHITSLSAREFEFLCRGVLATLGCQDPRVTTHSGDQGIDFFGRLSLANRLDNNATLPALDTDMHLWFAGQAKHRPTARISTDEVRHIIGSVAMARAGILARGGETLEGFKPKYVDPVIVALITSGTFSRDTHKLITSAGVIALDRNRLASFLCDNRIGLDDDETFSQRLANEWVQANRPAST